MGQDKTQELLKEKLRGKGLKVTHQRLQVLSVLEENGGRHMTAEDIYELVSRGQPGDRPCNGIQNPAAFTGYAVGGPD